MGVKHCGWCNSTDTSSGFDTVSCNDCGKSTYVSDGSKVEQVRRFETVDMLTGEVLGSTPAPPEPVAEPGPSKKSKKVKA